MRPRALRLTEHRREHAEVPVRGPVAGDEVPDHHVRARERLELRIQELGRDFVAERRARVGEVRERREPERLAVAIDPLVDDPVELPLRLGFHSQLGEQGNETGAPRPSYGPGLRRGARRPARAPRGALARGGR